MKKVLLDENLPKQLAKKFSTELSIATVPDLGWQSKTNGELLRAMGEEGFDILLTADRNLRFQQNLASFHIKVAVLLVHDTRLKHLTGLVSRIEASIVDWNDENDVLEIDLRS